MSLPTFTGDEVDAIAAAAHAEGLKYLRCPRDGAALRVGPMVARQVEPDEPVHGVRDGDADVTFMAVECPKCGAGAAHVALRRE